MSYYFTGKLVCDLDDLSPQFIIVVYQSNAVEVVEDLTCSGVSNDQR